MDVRENIKRIYKNDTKRNRFINALKRMKSHNHNGSASASGGMYQQYVDWHNLMVPENVIDSLGNNVELFDYEVTTAGSIKPTDVFKSIKIDGYTLTFPDQHLLSDRVKLRNSLMASVSNSGSFSSSPVYAIFNVTSSGSDIKIECRNCPLNIEEFNCTIDSADQTFAFTKGPSLGNFQLTGMTIAHVNSMFLPWHRVFLRLFELDLQHADRQLGNDGKIALPFWDWVKDGSSSSFIWDKKMMGANSGVADANSDHFSQGNGWPVFPPAAGRSLVRDYDTSDAAIPTKADVDHALSLDSYDGDDFSRSTTVDSFRNYLEGWVSGPKLHNAMHVLVGGTNSTGTPIGDMAEVPIAPNDPIFFLHHCNVDRIWATWQKKHRKKKQYPDFGPLPGRRKDDPIKPWGGITINGKTLNIKTNEVLYWQNLPSSLHASHGSKGYKYECETSVKLTNP